MSTSEHRQRGKRRMSSMSFALITAPFRMFSYGARSAHSALRRPANVRRITQSEEFTSDSTAQPQQQLHAWDRLMAGPLAAVQRQSTSHSDLQSCFPTQLCRNSGPTALTSSCQQLATTGTRVFGGRSPLQVRIYDFAVYFDAKQAQRSALSQRRASPASPTFAAALRSSSDIDMSLVVRAARNLPLRLMKAEYERILRRRLSTVGGHPDDAALSEMLSSFREEDLPGHVLRRGSIQKGSVITFARGAGGRVTASAGGRQLASVCSPHLAAALFDLYIGYQPVSQTAKQAALESAGRMFVRGSDYMPPADVPGVCVRAPAASKAPQWHTFAAAT